jgi:hypothetical protein
MSMKNVIGSKKVRRISGLVIATAVVVTPYVALAGGGSNIG